MKSRLVIEGGDFKMPVDMKDLIAEATGRLIFEKKVKKLTVTDIVQECNITRQAFYYHFEDIPELLEWILEKNSEKLLEECMKQKNPEDGLAYFFVTVSRMKSYAERGLQSIYGNEIERILSDFIFNFFKIASEKSGIYNDYSDKDRDFMLRYHCHAITGILRGWTKEDDDNIDYIAHQVYLMMQGENE